jgi:hypothetical protein
MKPPFRIFLLHMSQLQAGQIFVIELCNAWAMQKEILNARIIENGKSTRKWILGFSWQGKKQRGKEKNERSKGKGGGAQRP